MPEDGFTSHDGVSTQTSSFIPRSDDDLWAVHAITGESTTQYRVKWTGIDPKTKKPWPESWVPKTDCTDDLVEIWKAKMKSKKGHAHKYDSVSSPIESSLPFGQKRKRHSKGRTTDSTDTSRTENANPSKKPKCDLQVDLAPFQVIASDKTKQRGLKKKHDDRFPRPQESVSHSLQIPPSNSEGAKSLHSLIKIGPPRGVRKQQPTRVVTSPPQPRGFASLPTPIVTSTLHSQEVSLHSSTLASLEAFDRAMAESDRLRSVEVIQQCHAQETSKEDRLHIHQAIQASIGTDPNDTTDTNVIPYHKVPSDRGPDLSELLAKAEEMKRHHCTISIAVNAALKLAIEIIEIVDDHRPSGGSIDASTKK